jgi:hypothetical protein
VCFSILFVHAVALAKPSYVSPLSNIFLLPLADGDCSNFSKSMSQDMQFKNTDTNKSKDIKRGRDSTTTETAKERQRQTRHTWKMVSMDMSQTSRNEHAIYQAMTTMTRTGNTGALITFVMPFEMSPPACT